MLIAYVEDRCGAATGDRLESLEIGFDPSSGKLTLGFYNRSLTEAYAYARQKIAFAGFPSLFDLLQSFTPSGEIGFRVSYMPEGFPAADHFDTYWGPLTRPIDFSQAQGLQCDYPAQPPSVGEYLEVADTVPGPAPGTGYYYVTAVTHQNQTRYGRRTNGGVQSGRDPQPLPACTTTREEISSTQQD